MEQYYFTELVHTRKVASRSEILVAHLQYCPSRCNFTSAVHTNQPRLKFLHSQPHTVAAISHSGPTILIVLLQLAGGLILREGALEQKACMWLLLHSTWPVQFAAILPAEGCAKHHLDITCKHDTV